MPNGSIHRKALAALKSSPASGTKEVLWDREVKGFGAYRTTADTVSFVYQYKMPGGKTKSRKLGNHGELTVEQARSMAADMAYQRRRGIDPIAEMQRAANEENAKTELVLANYADAYLERRIKAAKPLNKAQTKIVRVDVIGLLGHLRMDQMSVDDVEGFANSLAERGPSARRMGLVYLNTILNEAVSRQKIASNPAKHVEINKPGERSRRLREDELMRFLEAAHDVGGPRGDIYEVLVRLAKRKEEITGMQWEQLDLNLRELHIPDTASKNGEPYIVELPRQVFDIIIQQQPDASLRRGPVFTLDGGRTQPEMGSQVKDLLDANMSRRLDLANDRDGTALSVGHFTIHDLRTTVASRLEEKPFLVPTSVIDSILLHKKEGKVTRTYQRAKLGTEAGEALQVWNDHVDKLMAHADAWPGGDRLEALTPSERKAHIEKFRQGWPLRTDQRKAKERLEAEAKAGVGSGRKRRTTKSG